VFIFFQLEFFGFPAGKSFFRGKYLERNTLLYGVKLSKKSGKD